MGVEGAHHSMYVGAKGRQWSQKSHRKLKISISHGVVILASEPDDMLEAAKLYVVRAFFRSLLFTALILHGKHFSCKKMIQYHKSAGFRNCITAIVVFYQTNGTKVKIDRLVDFIYEPFFKPAVGLNIFNLRATIAAMNDPLYKYQFKYRNIYTVDNYRQITCISTGEKFAFSYTGTAQKLHRHRLQVLKVQITYS